MRGDEEAVAIQNTQLSICKFFLCLIQLPGFILNPRKVHTFRVLFSLGNSKVIYRIFTIISNYLLHILSSVRCGCFLVQITSVCLHFFILAWFYLLDTKKHEIMGTRQSFS